MFPWSSRKGNTILSFKENLAKGKWEAFILIQASKNGKNHTSIITFSL